MLDETVPTNLLGNAGTTPSPVLELSELRTKVKALRVEVENAFHGTDKTSAQVDSLQQQLQNATQEFDKLAVSLGPDTAQQFQQLAADLNTISTSVGALKYRVSKLSYFHCVIFVKIVFKVYFTSTLVKQGFGEVGQ